MSTSIAKPRIIAITGATGTGKSELAVALAEKYNGEIINGDALQMYEGLPIATNKLPVAERKSIPHHLLGCISLNEEPWTVGKFVAIATRTIRDITQRGKIPIIVGGTHYYIQSLLFEDSLANTDVGHRTAEAQERKWPILAASTRDMLVELQKIDPEHASRWHPNDRRKIRHSLEVYFTSGRRPSDLYREQRESIAKAQQPEPLDLETDDNNGTTTQVELSSLRYDPLILWIYADLDKLSVRLNQRVEGMVRSGLTIEVKLMLQHLKKQELGTHVDRSCGIWAAIGFKELLPYVSASVESNLPIDRLEELKTECIEKTQTATRQYARRQHRWIRNTLLRALQDHGVRGRLILLNGTELSQWQHNVGSTANAVVSAFLEGRPIPTPTTLSDVESEVLASCAKPHIKARYCETCNMTLMTQKEWDAHPKSKKHRRAATTPKDWKKLYPKSRGDEFVSSSDPTPGRG
ncbi:MAG: hypothetical protein Q9211_001621 [Gyalolechia sp. 1 TL-2023]